MGIEQWWKGTAPPTRDDLARYEAAAEAAYDAMYDPKDHYHAKELRDDALGALLTAIKIAKFLGLPKEAARLEKRYDHIYAVYAHQFRM